MAVLIWAPSRTLNAYLCLPRRLEQRLCGIRVWLPSNFTPERPPGNSVISQYIFPFESLDAPFSKQTVPGLKIFDLQTNRTYVWTAIEFIISNVQVEYNAHTALRCSRKHCMALAVWRLNIQYGNVWGCFDYFCIILLLLLRAVSLFFWLTYKYDIHRFKEWISFVNWGLSVYRIYQCNVLAKQNTQSFSEFDSISL